MFLSLGLCYVRAVFDLFNLLTSEDLDESIFIVWNIRRSQRQQIHKILADGDEGFVYTASRICTAPGLTEWNINSSWCSVFFWKILQAGKTIHLFLHVLFILFVLLPWIKYQIAKIN